MLILAIETSCDETGLALAEASGGLSAPKFKVLKNLISSQINIHRPFGGVVPMLAKREHLKNLPILLKKCQVSGVRCQDVGLIAVTVGPGLEPALWAGITFAKELRRKLSAISHKPLAIIGANHMEGHLYSFLLSKKTEFSSRNFQFSKMFPAVALIVSGGHTILLLMESLTKWEKLGETRDDAAGEAFDKVARMLKLPYPGGPEIERLALSLPKGEKPSINFPRPMLDQKNYDFSFSGLKTAVLYYIRDHASSTNNESYTNKRIRKFESHSLFADIGASFQQAVIDVLVSKTIRAAREYGAKSIILCGGVAANKLLRQRLKTESSKLKAHFFAPDSEYNTDNAAMIAAAGYFAYLRGKKSAKGARLPDGQGSASDGKKLPLTANGDLGI